MKYIVIYILVFIVFPAAFFLPFHVRKKDEQTEILSKSDTNILRGFAACSVMIAHYTVYCMREADDFGGLMSAWKWAGGIGVCIFFFCSGYGILLSTANKEVNKQFLWKRIKGILPTYWILRLIFGIATKKMKNGVLYFILYIVGIKRPAWFVTEILLVYLLFYISVKISKRKEILVMTVMLAIMSFFFFLLGFEAMWYNANLLFALGMVFARYKDSIIDWFNEKYFLKVVVAFFFFCMLAGMFVILKEKGISFDGMKLLAGGLVCTVLFQVLIKLKLESACMIFIGRNSLPLYLIHSNIWTICSQGNVLQNLQLKFCVCVAMSLLCIWIYDKGRCVIKSLERSTSVFKIR